MGDESSRKGSVGSVAEETARLLEALFGEGNVPPTRPGPPAAPADATPETPPDGTGEREAEPGTRHTQVCGACGQQVGAGAAEPSPEPASGVCHRCPVCQLVSAVRSVSPETVERLADLAAALTQTLREVAASRWVETGRPPAQRHRSTVEDIDVHGDDDPTDEENHP